MAYAHYDADGQIRGYVLHALRAMRAACPDIRFVTTSRLQPGEAEKLRPLVREVHEIDNVGYDFFMWKRALTGIDLDEVDELVLMNSSVYGPFRDIGTVFAEMGTVPCDLWGITENLELDRHLQSYFLVFRRTVLASDAFHAFWESVLPYRDKRQVIRSYELGLTSWFTDAGFRLSAMIPWPRLADHLLAHPVEAQPIHWKVHGTSRVAARLRRRVRGALGVPRLKKLNPTVAYPAALIDLGVPFLKLEVMRDNPFTLDRKSLEDRLRALGYPLENLLPPAPAGRPGGA
jgi:lipopolysaccharide biosynthesis protein